MTIGDKVKDNIDGSLGIIIDKVASRCKCKGMGYWVVSFNGDIRKIKIDSGRISLHTFEAKTSSLSFNFK